MTCRYCFSFNLTAHVGRTDGESVERLWSELGRIAASTREMTPGLRHDVLNDHLNGHNWDKTINMCKQTVRKHWWCYLPPYVASSLRKKYINALREREQCQGQFDALCLELDARTVQKWSAKEDKWSLRNDIDKYKAYTIAETSGRSRLTSRESNRTE